MNHLTLVKTVQSFFDDCILIIKKKNPDYAHQGVALYDMFHTAFEEQVKPESVLRVLLTKHWSAVRAWTAGQSLSSETIEGRLQDSANYIAFLALLSAEHGPSLTWAIVKQAALEEDWTFMSWMEEFHRITFIK